MKRKIYWTWLTSLTLAWITAPPVKADEPIVRAVLFYSPSCPHCHQVITNDFPPLFDKYGDQLQIVGVDTSTVGGQKLFISAIERFSIPEERRAVPMLIIDEVILLGSGEIPEKLPGLVEEYLAQGGVDWPDVPGLREALATTQPQPTPTEEKITPTPKAPQKEEIVTGAPPSASVETTERPIPSPTPTTSNSNLILADQSSTNLRNRLARDPVGNTLAILVLIGMLASIVGSLVLFRSPPEWANPGRPTFAIPILCLAGIAIAVYLSYVETTQVTAVCGPIGDCNTVQQSEYARLFGILPIGILGLVGYVAILASWLVGRYGSDRTAQRASLALLGMTLFGTLYSIYLTFLEPFVIGATCAWCLSSAVIMTILMWLSITPGKIALSSFCHGENYPVKKRSLKNSIQDK